MLRIRWALTGLAGVLSVVLIVNGNVIIVLVGAMTVMRVALLVKWQQRRAEMRRP